MDWRQHRDSTNIRYLLEVASTIGVAPEVCLADTGLSQSQLDGGDGYQLWQELAVIRNLVAHWPHPGLGLRVGQCYHLTSLGLLGYAMLSSRTLWEAIEVSGRFRSLALSICPVVLSPAEQGVWMCLDTSVLPEDARCLVAERGLAAWKRIFAELLQRPFAPLQITLAGPAEALASDYSACFDCPVLLGQPRDGMLIARSDLESALPLANAQTQHTCASLCQHLCDGLADIQGGLARQVLQRLMSHSGKLCRADEVAAWLGISQRTLHRCLADEGYPFRVLDERVRRNLAERLLRDSMLGLESIAQQLGYAEAASFSRAFKRWSGMSPNLWRRQGADAWEKALAELPA